MPPSAGPADAFWILVGSGVFFWAAHVYAELPSRRLHTKHPLTRTGVAQVMWHEWPLFQATFPLAVPLALSCALASRALPGLASAAAVSRSAATTSVGEPLPVTVEVTGAAAAAGAELVVVRTPRPTVGVRPESR